MKQNIIHIGLDVDDTQYHGAALHPTTGEFLDFKCRPNLKGLLGQLDKLHEYFPASTFKLCYEASYIGYTLQRDLVEKGDHCDVVAPTSPLFSRPFVARRRKVVPCLYFATEEGAGIVDTMSNALTESNAVKVRHNVVAVEGW
ncbi:MAG: hypothetical protein GY896_07125 [Gammaproteobacteria bacterium]|nr:hypothetical protein [Gammaproteobacteria bacterium]